jgi:release factor glutamine methyltransferase
MTSRAMTPSPLEGEGRGGGSGPEISNSRHLLLAQATATLRAAGIDSPRREARWLLEHAGGNQAAFQTLIARRAAREPLAYLLGHQEFWSLDLAVSPATLIPRADSETLITAALATFPDRARVRRILDLGTGTGCLLLAALSEFKAAFGVGLDRVPSAAALAARNATACGLRGRTGFVCADWAAPIRGRFDLVLCNPPYIETGAIATLMPEVSRWEPRTALDGGADGLDPWRRLVQMLPALLAAGGAAVVEMGMGQAERVTALARHAGCCDPALHYDTAGIARAAVLMLPSD